MDSSKKSAVQIKYAPFSAAALKWIATASMVVDHLAAVVLKGWFNSCYTQMTKKEIVFWNTVYEWTRHIGRMVFPLFAYLLVEGFFHTSDRRKYGLRLLLFAVLSEIPYDLAVRGRFCDWGKQNTLFSLFLGLIVLCGMNWIYVNYASLQSRADEEKAEGRTFSLYWVEFLLQMLVLAAGCGLAYICRLDYSYQGIALIALFYFLHLYPLASAVGGFCIFIESPWSAPAFLMIPFYNGKRGRKQKWLYFFYPLHLLALYGLLQVILIL